MQAITEIPASVRVIDAATDMMYQIGQLQAEVSRMRGYGLDLAFDIETTSLDPFTDKIVILAFKPKGKKTVVVDVRHVTEDGLLLIGARLAPLFDGTVTLVGQNLKYDLSWMLVKMGLAAHKLYDMMIAELVILGLGMHEASDKGIHLSMDAIAKRYGIEVSKEERNWFIGLDTRIEGQVLSQVGIRTESEPSAWDEYGEPIEWQDVEYPVMEMVGGHRPWDEPLPPEQLAYIRQDVSVPHKVHDAQQAAINEYGLHEVIDLEMDFLPVVVGKEVWGVQIDRDGWLSVIDRVSAIAKVLERRVHLGTRKDLDIFLGLQKETWQRFYDANLEDRTWDEYSAESVAWWEKQNGAVYDGLDIHVLKVRHEKYMDKWLPYQDWMLDRDTFIINRKAEWEGLMEGKPKGHMIVLPEGSFRTWGEYKKFMQDWWYDRHEKLARPPENKAGVNLGSWMQVRDGFNDLGIPVKGVSEEELTPYIGKHPLVQVYIDYKHAQKIVDVYGRERGKKEHSFIEMLDATDRLRARYHQIGAGTGRESSYEPNLQQIPKAGVGSDLRKYVVAAPGHTFVIADYNSIELRITAEYSHDPFLLGAFTSGVDIHSYTAGVMFNLAPEQINKAWTDSHNVVLNGREIENVHYRDVAKTINYMLLYGAGKTRLAVELHIPESDAEKLLKMYYETFAVAIGWLDAQKSRLDVARKRGETRISSVTKSGRRRWFAIPPYPKSPGKSGQWTVEATEKYQEDQKAWRKQMAGIRRQLANSPIQGTSADITKWAAKQWYRQFGYDNEMRLVALVHDEIILEVLTERAEEAGLYLADVMMQAMSTYLKAVNLGQVHAVITPYWSH